MLQIENSTSNVNLDTTILNIMPDILPHTALCSYLNYAVDQVGGGGNHNKKTPPTSKHTRLLCLIWLLLIYEFKKKNLSFTYFFKQITITKHNFEFKVNLSSPLANQAISSKKNAL